MSVYEKMTAIADSIREKTGGTEPLTLDGMTEAIPEVYDKGKQAEYDAFWDVFQDDGNPKSYSHAFAGANWTLESFKPKYDLILSNNGATSMFQSAFTREPEPVDLVAVLDNLGIVLDTSGALFTSQNMFYDANIRHIGVIDASNPNVNMFTNCFRSAKIKRIDLVKLASNGSQAFTNTFTSANALEEITFEGVIGKVISFSYCTLLNKDSIANIVEHLSDTTSGITVTFSTAAKETAFTDDEWQTLIAAKPNWTFSLV